MIMVEDLYQQGFYNHFVDWSISAAPQYFIQYVIITRIYPTTNDVLLRVEECTSPYCDTPSSNCAVGVRRHSGSRMSFMVQQPFYLQYKTRRSARFCLHFLVPLRQHYCAGWLLHLEEQIIRATGGRR